jgi:hypothetical protein
VTAALPRVRVKTLLYSSASFLPSPPPSPINYQPHCHRLVLLYCHSGRTSHFLSLAGKDDVRAMALQVSVTPKRSLCSSVYHHTSQARCALLRAVHHKTLLQVTLLPFLPLLFRSKLHAVRFCVSRVGEDCSMLTAFFPLNHPFFHCHTLAFTRSGFRILKLDFAIVCVISSSKSILSRALHLVR